MTKLLNLITVIPWIMYYIEIYYYRISVLEDCKLDKKKYFSHINKHLFESINIKEIILFFIFVIFMHYDKIYVLKILFITFYIYLLIDFFLTLAEKCKKINHPVIMGQVIILCSLIIIHYLIFKDLTLTYIFMFIASILNSFITYIFGVINKKLVNK